MSTRLYSERRISHSSARARYEDAREAVEHCRALTDRPRQWAIGVLRVLARSRGVRVIVQGGGNDRHVRVLMPSGQRFTVWVPADGRVYDRDLRDLFDAADYITANFPEVIR